jgi:hypothetical protein
MERLGRRYHLSVNALHHGLKEATLPRRARAPEPLPSSVDLSYKMPRVYDQGHLGSCTAQAAASLIETQCGYPASQLFIYLAELAEEGERGVDAGASMEVCCDAITLYGACRRSSLPYSDSAEALLSRPPRAAFLEALALRDFRVFPVQRSELRAVLAQGIPIALGIVIYESAESPEVAATGDVPMPAAGEAALGGHAIVLAGYCTVRSRYLFRNSWGTEWGSDGYGTLPFAYIESTELADGFFALHRLIDESMCRP